MSLAPSAPYRIVVVGTSWGGLHALRVLLGGLKAGFPLPLAVVQHRGRGAEELLGPLLQEHTALVIHEGEDKEPMAPGNVYLAPADYHMLVDDGSIVLSVDEPVGYSRPSIDVLFESAADSYRAGVIGVVLTGANHDGAAGLRRIKQAGGYAIVQNPSTAESPVMPAAAIAATSVDRVLPLVEIATFLTELCTNGPSPRVAGPARR